MKRRSFGIPEMLLFLSVAILVIVVAVPVLLILYTSFFVDGHFNVGQVMSILSEPDIYEALLNSLFIASGTCIMSTFIGTLFAWLVVRTDLPYKGFMKTLFLVPFMLPSFIGAIAWKMLLSPRSGYINLMLMDLFNLEEPVFNIYGYGGIMAIETMYLFPFVFIQVCGALERMDPTLEECARIAGAKQFYVIRKVTLPLVMPAISSGMLLVLITSISNYGIAATLGFSANVYTLPTKITEIMQAAMGSFDGIRRASIVSILLVIVVAIALVIQAKVLNSGSYDIIKGKAMRPALMKLRGARYPMMFVALVSLFVMVVMPFICIIVVSFLKTFGMDPFVGTSYTLKNYKDIFATSSVWRSTGNSLLLSFGAGFLALFLGVMLSWVIYKVKPKGKGGLEFMAVLPYSIPGTVLAVGCMLAWSGKLGINIYNTLWILLICYTARFLSYTLKACSASLQQVHSSLEEASRMCGANRVQSLTDITIPLIKPAMLSSFFLVFQPAMRELTCSVLLCGPKTGVIATTLNSMRDGGYLSRASAFAVITMILIMAINGIVEWVLKDRKGV
jgi:iron(III) transport system permease protein